MDAMYLRDWRASGGDIGDFEALDTAHRAEWLTQIGGSGVGSLDVVLKDPHAVENGEDRSQSLFVELDRGVPKLVVGPDGGDALVIIRMVGSRLYIEHANRSELPTIVVDREGWQSVTLSDSEIGALGDRQPASENPKV